MDEILAIDRGGGKLSELEFFRSHDWAAIWQRYCGFLDLSMDEFMNIQERNLLDQIDMVSNSPLAALIFNNNKPKTVSEFRQFTRLTTYEDYLPHLAQNKENILAEKPFYWARTSGKDGVPKWVPFSMRADELLNRNTIGVALLAAAEKRGEITLWPGEKVLFNLPGRPFITGWIASSLNEHGLLVAA